MLNITTNSISDQINKNDFKSFKLLKKSRIKRLSLLLISSLFIIGFLCLFLPWTQNVNAKGYVTTRSPEQRPQSIQSIIPGKIEQWYVQEGDFVEAGDTIVFISEIKSEYFDPKLQERTSEQIDAKNQSIASYQQKVEALQRQFVALQKSSRLKSEQITNKLIQAKNKIEIDSIDLVALEYNQNINKNQYERTKELYNKGLKSLSELQEKEIKLQESLAKVKVQENKLLNQRNELLNLRLERLGVDQEYADKLAKSQSDKQSALSAKLSSLAETSKLENQLSNYNARQELYYITAPQSGYINKTIKKGIGETIKEGADIVNIVPSIYDLAIEIYLKPVDIPLLKIGKRVTIRFDGWPAIVISGWPESSTGVFSGEIVAIEQYISENGFYRALISPGDDEKSWPEELRVGTGANAFVLLNTVPIWYEIWRQLNGFPPDYYKQGDERRMEQIKRKAPLKSVK